MIWYVMVLKTVFNISITLICLSRNPFAYFTQIVYYAFLRRIAKEKRQMDIKDKILEKSGYDHVFTVDGDGGTEYNQIKNKAEMNLNDEDTADY